MDYTDKYKISLPKTIGRLLPFFVRGRRMYSLIYASLYPIISLHEEFRRWGQDRLSEVRINFVKVPVEKLLKQRLSVYFANPDDEFEFDLYAHKKYGVYLDYVEDAEMSGHEEIYVYDTAEEKESPRYIYRWSEVMGDTNNHFNLSAPNVAYDIDPEYYTTSIKKIISQYSLIKKYDIIIQDF